MTRGAGEAWEALSSAGRALGARDGSLAEADRMLADALRSAHRLATGSIQRIADIQADIDAAARHPAESPAAANEMARLTAAKHREVIEVIGRARAEAALKTTELQRLTDAYRITP